MIKGSHEDSTIYNQMIIATNEGRKPTPLKCRRNSIRKKGFQTTGYDPEDAKIGSHARVVKPRAWNLPNAHGYKIG